MAVKVLEDSNVENDPLKGEPHFSHLLQIHFAFPLGIQSIAGHLKTLQATAQSHKYIPVLQKIDLNAEKTLFDV